MRRRQWRASFLPILLLLLCEPSLLSGQKQQLDLPLDLVKLPPGFEIRLYSETKVVGARHLALGLANNNGTIVYVSSNVGGGVTALVDRDGDGVADESCVVVKGLDNPNGIVWHKGSLFVQETLRLSRLDGIDFAVLNGCDTSLMRTVVLNDVDFPPQDGHAARALALGPDEMLYTSIAAPFNVAECTVLYCTLQRMYLNGTGLETFASGVRNVGGVAWSDDPALAGAAFFTVLERDLLGDDRPDDLVIMAPEAGAFYGFPYCHREGTGDPYRRDLGPGTIFADDQMVPPGVAVNGGGSNETVWPWCAANAEPPLQAIGPHVAPLGLTFYPSTIEGLPAQEGGPWPVQLWPEEYRGRLFVAEHGSWNRRIPIGYRVSSLEVSSEGEPVAHDVFAGGWLKEDLSVWGRPVGLLVMPDGSMLLAGDSEGAVYRITYEGLEG